MPADMTEKPNILIDRDRLHEIGFVPLNESVLHTLRTKRIEGEDFFLAHRNIQYHKRIATPENLDIREFP